MDVTGEESQQPGSTGTLGSSKTTATSGLLKLLKKSAKSEAEEKDDDDDVADKEHVYPVLVTNGELIAKHSTDDRNKLVVELIFFEPESGMPKLLGKMTLNLLDIVHKMTFTELHDVKLKGQVICKIELEISFTYGSLGYGYSHQLRHPQKDLQTIAERSQFLRIFPLEQRKDPHFNVTTGRPSEYPEFLSPHLNVQVGSPAKSEHNILSSSPVEDLSIPKMSQMVLEIMQTRKRLNELKKVYENFQTRGESIQFIEKLVMKKGPRQNNPPRMYKKFKVNKWKKAAALIPILVAAVTPEVKSRDVAVPLMKHVSFQEDPEQGLREHTTVDVAGLLKHQLPEEDSKANNVLEKTDTEELQLHLSSSNQPNRQPDIQVVKA
ncbi:uncharacterized protein c2cd6 [Lepisosteus oculatus]|uniref:uncharacterized protein c2cd6 n=1 Tax=Lepisosteus oculatus TaxID=7918 RepID=UPI0035F50B29